MGCREGGRPCGNKDEEIRAGPRLEIRVQNQRILKTNLIKSYNSNPKVREPHISDQELNQWLSSLATHECHF